MELVSFLLVAEVLLADMDGDPRLEWTEDHVSEDHQTKVQDS